MIFTSYIAELKRLDEIETEIYQTSPNPPITFENKETKLLREIKKLQSHIVKQMAVALEINGTCHRPHMDMD